MTMSGLLVPMVISFLKGMPNETSSELLMGTSEVVGLFLTHGMEELRDSEILVLRAKTKYVKRVRQGTFFSQE